MFPRIKTLKKYLDISYSNVLNVFDAKKSIKTFTLIILICLRIK